MSIMILKAVWVFLFINLRHGVSVAKDELDLHRDLMSNYNSNVIPQENATTPVEIGKSVV